MNDLRQQEYGLVEGDAVYVDVRACLKDEPEICGGHSIISGGVVSILATASKMAPPVWTNPAERNLRLIDLEWEHSECIHCHDDDTNTYVVLWDQGYGYSDPRDFVQIARTYETTTSYQLATAGNFQFIIVEANDCGFSPYSDPMVVAIPEQDCQSCEAPDLLLDEPPRESIVLSWTPIAHVLGYNVWWDKGVEGGDFVMLEVDGNTLVTDRKVTIPLTSSSVNYRFKVVGKRREGCVMPAVPLPDCVESNILHVCLTTAPPAVMDVLNEYDGCGVKITIPVALSDPNDPASEYRLQIQAPNFQWVEVEDACLTPDPAEPQPLVCSFTMDELRSDYGFSDGNRINARAAAKNSFGGGDGIASDSYGWGAFSVAADTTVVQAAPYKLGRPYVIQKTISTLDLAWPMFIASYRDDALQGVEYELQWAVGDGVFEPLPGIRSITTQLAIHLDAADGLELGALYKFQVRALTDCGDGPWSETREVQLMAKPSPCDPVCGVNSGTEIRYDW
jgi:hypothetical protein